MAMAQTNADPQHPHVGTFDDWIMEAPIGTPLTISTPDYSGQNAVLAMNIEPGIEASDDFPEEDGSPVNPLKWEQVPTWDAGNTEVQDHEAEISVASGAEGKQNLGILPTLDFIATAQMSLEAGVGGSTYAATYLYIKQAGDDSVRGEVSVGLDSNGDVYLKVYNVITSTTLVLGPPETWLGVKIGVRAYRNPSPDQETIRFSYNLNQGGGWVDSLTRSSSGTPCEAVMYAITNSSTAVVSRYSSVEMLGNGGVPIIIGDNMTSLYVNGAKVASGDIGPNSIAAMQAMSNGLAGQCYEHRVYNRALTEQEVIDESAEMS